MELKPSGLNPPALPRWITHPWEYEWDDDNEISNRGRMSRFHPSLQSLGERMPSTVDVRIEEKRRTIARLEEEITRLQRQPTDIFRNGDAIRFRKNHYTYVALKMLGKWYLTQDGTRAGSRKPPQTWDGLLDFIGQKNWETIIELVPGVSWHNT